MNKKITVAILLAMAWLGCRETTPGYQPVTPTFQPAPAPAPAVSTTTTTTATASPTLTAVLPLPSSTPAPTWTPEATSVATAAPPNSQYNLFAHLDLDNYHLVVTQTVTYVNPLPAPLPELLFVVDMNRQPGIFTLRELRLAGSPAGAPYHLVGSRLTVPLPVPLAPGAATTLTLLYELNLPAQPGRLGYTPRQANLGDWYPFVPPHRPDGGWLVHPPGAVGEYLVYDVADYQASVRLSGAAENVVVAASVPAVVEGAWRRYSLPAGRSFAWSASSEYQVLQTTAGSVAVTAYVFPEDLTAGQAALEATAQALQLYGSLFAPYPRDSLAIVQAEFKDGLEYDGLYFLDQTLFRRYQGEAQEYLVPIAAHETAHQWWYGLVGNDQAAEPWLDESLATYSELLFYEAVYPDLVDWWWQFRVRRFNPAGWVNSAIYEHPHFRSYVDAVYLRGALFLDELRQLMGDAAFLAFLQAYARQYAHRQATAAEFWLTLNQYSNVDTGGLLPEYFAPAAPARSQPKFYWQPGGLLRDAKRQQLLLK
ncbi:MAG: M1 family metallopeptidase [Chloroflexi bacterium]|nr:M1 family metallopeptidase [Chloroflexota bacterium]MCI0575155.1 M1 family metallopeptidase [Chloroflexota bacterium]MCI0647163.1 M1 family metallopeptidase [Chloroflexota bacterium]MCI0729961.1 M1 family metallopeptidase [Chloroflexota bacterium]